MWIDGLLEYDEMVGIDWEWQSMDGVRTKAPLGGKKYRSKPYRAKSGNKRSLLVEGAGVPIGVMVDGADRHDMKLARPTLDSVVVPRPEPTKDEPQNICLDKAYDFPEVRDLKEYGYTARIRSRGEEINDKKKIPRYRARR